MLGLKLNHVSKRGHWSSHMKVSKGMLITEPLEVSLIFSRTWMKTQYQWCEVCAKWTACFACTHLLITTNLSLMSTVRKHVHIYFAKIILECLQFDLANLLTMKRLTLMMILWRFSSRMCFTSFTWVLDIITSMLTLHSKTCVKWTPQLTPFEQHLINTYQFYQHVMRW